jgi:hypothetical protein
VADVETCDGSRAVLTRAVEVLRADAAARGARPAATPLFLYLSLSLAPDRGQGGVGSGDGDGGGGGGGDGGGDVGEDGAATMDAAEVLCEVEAALGTSKCNALLVTGSQCDLRPGRDLAKLRHACSEPSSTLGWRADQERSLKDAVKHSNLCKMTFRVVNSSSSDGDGEAGEDFTAAAAGAAAGAEAEAGASASESERAGRGC